MQFMLMQHYGALGQDSVPMDQWTPAEIRAHIEFQQELNRELETLGELVDAQGLAGPAEARFVVSDGVSAPLVTDGPFPESKELLAGYRVVDVDTPERALAIAALVSAAPGHGGAPIRQPIEVRQIMAAPDVGD